ncbi:MULTISPECIES: NAD-dependent epimerase/dehydratase family protein [Halorubrum]|uniref:NAD-dependent epimerase/dehydratase family protein n=1 Tax=Halorubrum TaxID=56688 RepID=UPI00097F8247|nr:MULTISPECIES: NAD-dependent epimerase/dehydratase family protein [Halorubrum]TKX44630.1 NAD-dependent epimerase/dehydratase family protein [Halorubrum sp. ARQ200]TKX48959.1 NAD-dependent epimerase/dehydratase family protein [Halorubrum sp. ASP121]
MNTPTGQSILVTGGAGFIGSHLVETLVTDNDVTVLDNLSSGRREWVADQATLIEADIRDSEAAEEAAAGADLIFHEAANVSVEQSVEEPVDSHEVNVDATLQLLECARKEGARFIYASSAAVYGTPDSVPIRETDPKAPASPYGLEKLTAEEYCRLYNELYDVETIMLRYFNAYGPRQRGGQYSGVIDVFLGQARRGEDITVHGDGEQTRDFVHVDDVVAANCLAAVNGTPGEAYNIGTGKSISIKALAQLIVDTVESDSRITHVAARDGDIERSRPSIQKARAELGFEPSRSLGSEIESLC